MTTYQPAYRATIYGPRSADPTEATILTPVAGAAHSDQFKVTSLRSLAGWKPYMDLPRGRRGNIDVRTKRVDVGELAFRILDVRTGSPNAVRWVTAFLGDVKGTSRMTGLKVVVEESLIGGKEKNAGSASNVSNRKFCQLFRRPSVYVPPNGLFHYSIYNKLWSGTHSATRFRLRLEHGVDLSAREHFEGFA